MLFALFTNLILGFLQLFFVFKGDVFFVLLVYPSYALVGVISLPRGFAYIKAQSKNMYVLSLALFCTALILLLGSLVCGAFFSVIQIPTILQAGSLSEVISLLKIIPSTIVFAVFAFMFGFVFFIPFVFLNIIFFFCYRTSLRSCSSHNSI